MSSQTEDYYAVLGVGSSASADKIKHTYHALVKTYHPDVNKTPQAAETFRNITEAYEVLRNPEKRRAYDNARLENNSYQKKNEIFSEKEKILEPIRCSACGSITALPRLRTYKQVIGFIFRTKTTSKSGIFCANCALKSAVKASLVSSILGWWGLPFGPIITVKEVVGNALGGIRNRRADEQLQWHNAVAFLNQGKPDLSIALASRLRAAQDNDIREKAQTLYDTLVARGVRPRQFRESRVTEMGYGFAQLISGALIPCGLIFLLVSENIFTSNHFMEPATNSNRGAGIAGIYNSPSDRPDWNLNICHHKPENGTVIRASMILFPDGNWLTINNKTNMDAIVKIRDAETGQSLLSFFTSKGKITTIKGIKDGNYDIQYATGTEINDSCSGFINGSAYRFPGIQTLNTQRAIVGTNVLTRGEGLSFTLYGALVGNIKPQRISDAEFNADW